MDSRRESRQFSAPPIQYQTQSSHVMDRLPMQGGWMGNLYSFIYVPDCMSTVHILFHYFLWDKIPLSKSSKGQGCYVPLNPIYITAYIEKMP